MATKTRTGSRASRTRATNPARPPVTEPVDRVYAGKVTVARTRVDVPMLVLRGEWLKAIGFPIGAKAFLSTDKQGDIQLTRMGLKRPRRLRVVRRNRDAAERWAEAHPMDQGPMRLSAGMPKLRCRLRIISTVRLRLPFNTS